MKKKKVYWPVIDEKTGESIGDWVDENVIEELCVALADYYGGNDDPEYPYM